MLTGIFLGVIVGSIIAIASLTASLSHLSQSGNLLSKANTTLFETRQIINEYNAKYPAFRFIVVYTSTVQLYGNATLTNVRNALAFATEREVLEFSRSVWKLGFETKWFAWNGIITRELTNQEFEAIENSFEGENVKNNSQSEVLTQ